MRSAAGRPLRYAARLPVFLALAVLLSTLPPARADAAQAARPPWAPGGFALTYDVYQAGFRVLRLDFDLALAERRYRTEVRLETSGIIGFLFDWHLDARSEGAWDGRSLAPVRHRSANVWRGRERSVAIAWRDGVPAEVVAEPPYGEDDRAKVTPAMLSDTMDPMSAVTAMILAHPRSGPCRAQTRIYDGRRRYDARLAPLGRRTIEASGFAGFAGEAEGCRLTFERIAGFEEGSTRFDGMQVDVWLADIGTGAGKVPVRLRLETPWGTGFAHLVRARRADGRLVFGEPEEE